MLSFLSAIFLLCSSKAGFGMVMQVNRLSRLSVTKTIFGFGKKKTAARQKRA